MHTSTSLSPITDINQLMHGAGLPVPPLPKDLTELMFRPENCDYYTSRVSAPGPWSLNWFLEELENGNPDNYLITGIDGHGFLSTAAHYYMVDPDIAFFHQTALPSQVQPELEQTLEDQYSLLAVMTVAVRQAKEQGVIPNESRLIIASPASRPAVWGVQPKPGQPVIWHDAEDALIESCNWLKARMH
ncbi:hypothetical protein EOPP23_07510 [Endozoicomonas sp. OPT23]|uniref:hypothetical protein n=1 Tax=Endozoicomonas sp. OPT23 TaxID=2072845 RepID=UPI00129B41F5|nr:hypothetical protein [Endozoicomonas sp. OPT23]MRI32830.1 hypothetical protein [Endozoicomonas sp. OPT23]